MPLYTLEIVEYELCLLKVLVMLEVLEMLEMLEVPEVMSFTFPVFVTLQAA
jgi:hypothetical protein